GGHLFDAERRGGFGGLAGFFGYVFQRPVRRQHRLGRFRRLRGARRGVEFLRRGDACGGDVELIEDRGEFVVQFGDVRLAAETDLGQFDRFVVRSGRRRGDIAQVEVVRQTDVEFVARRRCRLRGVGGGEQRVEFGGEI